MTYPMEPIWARETHFFSFYAIKFILPLPAKSDAGGSIYPKAMMKQVTLLIIKRQKVKSMTRIYQVEEVSAMRSFESKNRQGQPEQVKVKGIMMTDGSNKLFGEAFGDLAEGIEQMNLQKGDVVQVNMNTSVQERTKDGQVFLKNSITVTSLIVLTRNCF